MLCHVSVTLSLMNIRGLIPRNWPAVQIAWKGLTKLYRCARSFESFFLIVIAIIPNVMANLVILSHNSASSWQFGSDMCHYLVGKQQSFKLVGPLILSALLLDGSVKHVDIYDGWHV